MYDRQHTYEEVEQIETGIQWVLSAWRKTFGTAPASKLVFLDTETTGLKPAPDAAEIIEIAMVTEYPDGRVERWVSKVAPQHIETAHPKALEVNGFTPEAWEGAPAFTEIADTVIEKLSGATVIGHNVGFDLKFVRAALDEVGAGEITDLSFIDTQTLAKEHLKPLGLKSVSLVNIRRWFGWSIEGAHTAMADTEDCRRLYHKLKNPRPYQKRMWSWLGPPRMKASRR